MSKTTTNVQPISCVQAVKFYITELILNVYSVENFKTVSLFKFSINMLDGNKRRADVEVRVQLRHPISHPNKHPISTD